MYVTRFPEEVHNAYNHTVGFGPDDLPLARELSRGYRDQLRAFLKGATDGGDVGRELLALQSPTEVSPKRLVNELAELNRTMRHRVRLLEVFNTSRCNLTCRHCSAMIPLKGTRPFDADVDELRSSLEALVALLGTLMQTYDNELQS